MQSQLILNYALQFVVWSFVFLMIFDFVNGLLEHIRTAYIASSVTVLHCSPEMLTFESIADPWDWQVDATPVLTQSSNNIVRFQPLLPPAKELPILVQIENEVKAITWQQLRRIISDYHLSMKGKRSHLEQRLLEFCQTRNDEQLQTMLQYMRQLQIA